ncbi:MAG: transglycosylase SLT domain-containing protein [Deltaproteobacteria bacterium]|nr:transglycosylase SLT domain-containing protein [Deltaproteobacteria bacterium]
MTDFCRAAFKRNNQFIKVITGLVFLCYMLSFTALPLAMAATGKDIRAKDPDFPLYPSIKTNVDFWINIFTKFTKFQGLIHDTRHLGIIYEVIQLDASNTLRGKRKNKKLKKIVFKKYKNILLTLSKGKKPLSKEAKRVAALFGSNAQPSDFRTAAFNMRCQTGLKKEFKEGLIRSGAVIDEFKNIFRSHGLPVDLVFLPCVESSYNFKAYSKFGASGIWQFTRATGRLYMKIGYVVDERRDPYISTDAAARLLKKNYAELKEWPLALTAYNHGLSGIKRAKKSKGSYEKIIKSYRSRSFKFASKNFYSEFLAARIVAKNPNKYFGNIVLHKPVTFQTLKTKGYLQVKEVSDRLGINILDIRSLNPSLRKPVFNGQKYIPRGFKLRFPKIIPAPDINKRLAALYHDRQKPSRFHRVQKNDTAGSIARLHSVRLNDLILANSLNKRATIYIGQNLRLPVKDEIILARKGTAIIKPGKIIHKRTIAKAKAYRGKTPEFPREPKAKSIKDELSINPDIVTGNLKILKTYKKGKFIIGTIKVETEETLGHYAEWLKVPTGMIRALNKFKYGTPIAIDQIIKIPLGKKTIREFEEQRYEFHKEIEEDFFESFLIQGQEIYKVKSGDNIWSLCLNKLEIPFWLLKKYNPEMNFNSLLPMQKIKYPIINRQQAD